MRGGWIPDLPDKRDLLYKQVKKSVSIPDFVDLRLFCSPIEDQETIGSCTAQALVANIELLRIKNENKPFEDLSRLFLYYETRKLEFSINQDSGAMLRTGIKALNNTGVCPESLWPYYVSKFRKKPTPKCYEEAIKRRIVSYHRILSLGEMLNCLTEGYPFVFGFSMYSGFDKVAKTGVAEMPKKSEYSNGGHAVMAVGFDKKKEVFIVRNSWGIKWGDKGYFTMPFEYLETLADDFWVIKS